MSNPVKKQILARLLEICQPLVNSDLVRKIERRQGLFLSESVRPALHIVAGDESVLSQDTRGYNIKLPVAFQFIFNEERDPNGLGDDFECALQAIMEADEQLPDKNGTKLCSKLTYEGSSQYVSAELKPFCLVIVMYQLEYRRQKGAPQTSY